MNRPNTTDRNLDRRGSRPSKPPHAARRISWAKGRSNEDIQVTLSYESSVAKEQGSQAKLLAELVHEIKYRLVEYDKKDEEADTQVVFSNSGPFSEYTTEDIEIVLQNQLLKARAAVPQDPCVSLSVKMVAEIGYRLGVYEKSFGELPQKEDDY